MLVCDKVIFVQTETNHKDEIYVDGHPSDRRCLLTILAVGHADLHASEEVASVFVAMYQQIDYPFLTTLLRGLHYFKHRRQLGCPSLLRHQGRNLHVPSVRFPEMCLD